MVSILFIFNRNALIYWGIALGHRARGGVARRHIRWAFTFVAEVFHVLVWTAFVFLPESYHGSGVRTLHLFVNSAFFSFVALLSVIDTGVCGDAVGCVVEPSTVSLFYKHQIRNVITWMLCLYRLSKWEVLACVNFIDQSVQIQRSYCIIITQKVIMHPSYCLSFMSVCLQFEVLADSLALKWVHIVPIWSPRAGGELVDTKRMLLINPQHRWRNIAGRLRGLLFKI